VLLAIFLFAADHLTKLAIERHFRPAPPASPPPSSVDLLGSALRLSYTQNRGVVFGLGNRPERDTRGGLSWFSLIAIAFLVVWFTRVPPDRRLALFGLALAIGGAAGNLVDRWFRGYVVDFIDVSLYFMRWYAFNVADAAIVTGVGMMMLDQIRTPEPE
jgi:signal peptidase II